VDDRDSGDAASVGGEKLRREVVAPLDDDVVPGDEVDGVVREEPMLVQVHRQCRRDGRQAARGCRALRGPDVGVLEEDLAMEIRAVDDVVVAQTERPHAGAHERQRRRTTETADADDQHPSVPAVHGASGKYSSRLK
jgi:hypothetical protein